MVNEKLLSILWCPKCQADALTPAQVVAPVGAGVPAGGTSGAASRQGTSFEALACGSCGAHFPIADGYPVLMPRESLTGASWTEWEEHLLKFQARREARVQNPDPINRLAERSSPQEAFARFTGIARGRVLDIGCGPGKFRHLFDTDHVEYVGLDPIPLPEASDFDFVQGVAEYLPFRSGSFTDVVVLAALDHFRDLDRFLDETRRVLRPDGRLHVLQSVHEVRGPISATRMIAHKLKDTVEDWRTEAFDRSVPKHLWEFTTRSLTDRIQDRFRLVSTGRYSATWYSPVKLFLSFAPLIAPVSEARTAPTARPARTPVTQGATH